MWEVYAWGLDLGCFVGGASFGFCFYVGYLCCYLSLVFCYCYGGLCFSGCGWVALCLRFGLVCEFGFACLFISFG